MERVEEINFEERVKQILSDDPSLGRLLSYYQDENGNVILNFGTDKDTEIVPVETTIPTATVTVDRDFSAVTSTELIAQVDPLIKPRQI